MRKSTGELENDVQSKEAERTKLACEVDSLQKKLSALESGKLGADAHNEEMQVRGGICDCLRNEEGVKHGCLVN